MMFQKSTPLAVAAILAMAPLSANAHMILANPVPYGSPNNSPLAADGSDFPCKSVPYTTNKMNNWSVGSSQVMSFTGTAVHGGGSCQVSVTTDKAPTKSSKWKVIHSFEGGCPDSVPGNLPEGAGSNDNATFPFTVPSELPNGEMSMAWTWFNKVGNREMYMNCAPITVSGGSTDTTAFDALPDMATANIGMGTCTTTESNDYTFQNPGKYTTSGGTGPFKELCGGTAATPGDTSAAPAASSQVAAPQASSANPAISSAAPVASQAPDLTSTLRTIVTVTAPMGSAATSASPDLESQSSQAPAAAPAPSSGTSAGQSCSPNGAIICQGDSEWGMCNFGTVVFAPVAQGTTCTNGVIGKREYAHRNMRSAI